MNGRTLGALLVIAAALLLLFRRTGAPAAEAPGTSPPRPEAAGPRDDRWFPLADGRTWRYAVAGEGGQTSTLEYRCREAEDDVFGVFEVSKTPSGERVDDIGELAPGPGESWVYRKGWQRGARRSTFLPEDPTPGATWEVRLGLHARVIDGASTADPESPGPGEFLVVRYEHPPPEGATASAEPEWVRTRWFQRGIGIVREESPSRDGGRRVLRLLRPDPGQS